MPAKTAPRKAPRKKSKAGIPPIDAPSMMAMAIGNLINMVVVMAVSGTVLLGLLAVKQF